MRVARSLSEFQAWRTAVQGRIALVPTMGALHEGHLSLLDIAREQASHSVVSLFVNPAQFGPGEDFDTYPRQVETDLAMLEAAGAGMAFLPGLEDVYPDQVHDGIEPDVVHPGPAANGLESDYRPHFFAGVVAVVYRLFAMVDPDVAVFGEKDYQQLQVIRDMVETHAMRLEIIGAPTRRDEHGLALSSRNAYLSAEELRTARLLNRVIFDVAARLAASGVSLPGVPASREMAVSTSTIESPASDHSTMCDEARHYLLAAGFESVDYLAIRPEWHRVLVAATIGRTRLIDNCAI